MLLSLTQLFRRERRVSSTNESQDRKAATHLRLKDERLDFLVSLNGELGLGKPRRGSRNILIERFLWIPREHLLDKHALELIRVLLDGLGDRLRSSETTVSVELEHAKQRQQDEPGKAP